MFITLKNDIRINVDHVRNYYGSEIGDVSVVEIEFIDEHSMYVQGMSVFDIDNLIQQKYVAINLVRNNEVGNTVGNSGGGASD